MQRNKVLLLASLGGAIVGALFTRLDFHIFTGIGALAIDHELLGHKKFLLACLAPWVIFGIYWDIAAKNSAAAKSSESRGSRGIHVFLANAALLIEIAPIRGLGRFVPVSLPIMGAGLAVEAMGLFVTVCARRHLGSNWSGEITIKVDHQLIRSGPYQRLRHPIYTGLLAMYAGVALVTGEWLAMIGLAMALFAYGRKIRIEEATLTKAFGAQFDAYRQETWALLPGIF